MRIRSSTTFSDSSSSLTMNFFYLNRLFRKCPPTPTIMFMVSTKSSSAYFSFNQFFRIIEFNYNVWFEFNWQISWFHMPGRYEIEFILFSMLPSVYFFKDLIFKKIRSRWVFKKKLVLILILSYLELQIRGINLWLTFLIFLDIDFHLKSRS